MRVQLPLALLAAACLVACAHLPSAGADDKKAAAPLSAAPVAAPDVHHPAGLPRASPPEPRSAPRSAVPVRRLVIGGSRQHRPIIAYEIGDRRLPSVLVVGCIHGSETAGVPVTRWLVAHAQSLPRVHLWVVPVLNPDGAAHGTRQNAAGVDLNRNFPYQWELRNRGTPQDSGPRVLSEPEAQAMTGLVRSARPTYGIWFHQALGVVDDSQGTPAIEALFSRQLRLPERRLTDYHGSAVGWENQLRPHSAFVVELRAGPLSGTDVRNAALAVIAAGRIAVAR